MGAVSALRKLNPFTARFMPKPPYKSIIYLSYAQADEPEMPFEGEVKWLSFVTGHLQAAEEIGVLEIWTEPLAPGADLVPEFQRKLRACDIFVPLVSPHSVAFEAVFGRQIAIIRERQAKGERVHLYPLLLTPTHETALDLEILRPPGGRPFSSYDMGERDRQMLDAADEIVEIATDAATLKTRRRSRPRAVSPASPAPKLSPPPRLAAEPERGDPGMFENWLREQSAEHVIAIAVRTMLRGVPFVARAARKGDNAKDACVFLTLTSAVFRAHALARIASKYPARANELNAVAHVAAARNAGAAAAANVADIRALGHTAFTFAIAGAAADAALAAPAPLDAAPVATSVYGHVAAFLAAAAAADPGARMRIHADVLALRELGADSLADLPLLSERPPPDWWQSDWERLNAALPSDEDWDVWIDWYKARLRGGSRGEAYELVFASAPQDVWDKGPAAANAWIKAHLPPDSGAPSLPDSPRRLPKPV